MNQYFMAGFWGDSGQATSSQRVHRASAILSSETEEVGHCVIPETVTREGMNRGVLDFADRERKFGFKERGRGSERGVCPNISQAYRSLLPLICASIRGW